MKTLIVFFLLLAKPGYSQSPSEGLVFTAATPVASNGGLVFSRATEDVQDTIAVRMESAIEDDEAEVTSEGVVSFFNPRIDHEFEQRKRHILTTVRENLLQSEDLFLCVDNYLSGYAEAPLEGERVRLERTIEPVTLLDEEPIEVDEGGKISKFVKITYDGTDYWAKESILEKSSEVLTSYITTFSGCAKIQSDIEEHKIEEALTAEIEARPPRSSRSKYVCTQESGRIGAHSDQELNRENELRDGAEVAILQGSASEPFDTDAGVTYIRVKHERSAYWVAQDYIKSYEDCPKIHTEAVEVCTAGKLNYYESDSQITGRDPVDQFNGFTGVYKFTGHIYSKKVVLNSSGQEVTYVPVKKTQDAEEIYWVAESYVPQECALNPEAKITFRGKHNSCTVVRNNNTPLRRWNNVEVPIPAQFNYYTDTARFDANRRGSRRHAGNDLYSYPRGSSRANNRWGAFVTAIDDGKVVSVAGYGRGTQRVTVQSKHGYTWNYAEVGRVQVKKDDWVRTGDHIATARKYANGSDYPAMLHLEKFNALITNPRGGAQNNRYRRNRSVTDPSCHVEYMENKQFGTRR